MTVQDTAEATDITTEPTGAPDSDSSTDTATAPVQADKDWEAEAAKWKALSRKHENANAQALKELEHLRTAQMSDAEKAIAEAERRGREAATAELSKQLAEARLRAAASGRVSDVDALVELVDVSKFVTENGVDDAAIAATIERFTKVLPAAPQPKFDDVELGPQGKRQRQLTREDLRTMTPSQIEDARLKGQLDSLLGISP